MCVCFIKRFVLKLLCIMDPSHCCLSLLVFKHDAQQIVYLTERTQTRTHKSKQCCQTCMFVPSCNVRMDLAGPVVCLCVFVCF